MTILKLNRTDTLCKDYENGGLKNVGITFKWTNLQFSWVKRLYDNSKHDYKLIPSHIITQNSKVIVTYTYI